MSFTVDTGAQVSRVPIECVRADQLTGKTQRVRSFQGSLVEGDACRVQFRIGDRTFDREAVAVKGELINWTPCFQVPLTPRTDMTYVLDLADAKAKKEEDQLYFPPRVEDGILKSGYMVSGEMGMSQPHGSVSSEPVGEGEGTIKGVGGDEIEKEVEESNTVEEDDVVQEVIELRDEGDDVLGEGGEKASDLDEVKGEPSGGSAGSGDSLISLEGIKGNRHQLAQATSVDESLRVARDLAKLVKGGYREVD